MNSDELQGGARYVGGKLEKAAGDAVDKPDWQIDGVIDQVAGGAQHAFGRVRGIVEDAMESAPAFADEARDRLKDAGGRAAETARHGGHVAANRVRDMPLLRVLGAGVAGYMLARLAHGPRT